MKRTLALVLAALAASSSAFAEDIDFHPNGFVSAVIRESKPDHQRNATLVEKSRAQVRAETLEAARLGLLSPSEAGGTQPTTEQARQIEQAGRRAVVIEAASK